MMRPPLSAETSTEPMKEAAPLPFVSVVMPAYNEEHYIEHILLELLKQDYPKGQFEVIVADGLSSDRTAAVVKRIQVHHPNVVLIENPDRIVSTGLNRAIQKARGEIVIRVDGHCEYPRNYLRKLVRLRDETKADNIGGVLVPIGSGYTQRAIAEAYYSRIGVGGTALRARSESGSPIEVDAVHGGCWRRERLLAVGGFDETMVRNQDDELSFRLRKQSGKIFQIPDLRVKYHVRNSFLKLFMQFAQYGYWKVQVVRKHPQQASLRHIVPATFVSVLLILALAAPFASLAGWTLAGLVGVYFSVLVISTGIQLRLSPFLWPGVIMAVMMMHFGYGFGFLAGVLHALLGPLPTDRVFEKVTR